MRQTSPDELLFFSGHPAAYPLYERFAGKLLEEFPDTSVRVQKSQITFSNRHVYACVSFLRVRGKAGEYFVVTLGLPYPLDTARVAARTEPYPGSWTTHIAISALEEVDGELLAWVRQAYEFSACK